MLHDIDEITRPELSNCIYSSTICKSYVINYKLNLVQFPVALQKRKIVLPMLQPLRL